MFQQDLLGFLGMGQGVRTGLNRESATELGMGLGTGYKGKEGEEDLELDLSGLLASLAGLGGQCPRDACWSWGLGYQMNGKED